MAELTTAQIIKLILVVFVITVVLIGMYLFFKQYVFGFFKTLPGTEEKIKLTLGLLR